MSLRPRTVVAALTALAATAGAVAPTAAAELPPEPVIPAMLTLAEAVALFRAHGLDLLIAEAAAQGAEGDALAAGAVQNPSVTGGYYHSFFQDPAFETHNGWFVGLGDSNAIVDTLSGKRGLRRNVADAALAAARLGRADAQRTLELQVKETYFQAVAARAALEFAREIAESTAHTFDLNQIRYKSGAISEVDLSRTETVKLEAEQAVDAAMLALRNAKVQLGVSAGAAPRLQQLRHRREPAPFRDAGGTRQRHGRHAGRSRDPGAAGSESAGEPADARRPGGVAGPSPALPRHRRQRAVLRAGLRLVNGNAISPPTLEIALTGSLPLFYQQQGEIKKAEADARTQDAQAAKLRAQVVADVENAFAGYQTSQRQVQRMEGRLLDRARRARELVELQYQKGAASLLEFLDAQRTYVTTKGEYIQELTAYWDAIFQIEAATATGVVQ